MFFSQVSEYFSSLENTTLRNKMVEVLSDLFSDASKDEIGKLCYLLQGRVGSLYDGIELGVADKMMIKAASDSLDIEQKFALKILIEWCNRSNVIL